MNDKLIEQEQLRSDKPDFPPGLAPLSFLSGGQILNGVGLLTSGRGPNPAVILLHGFPGYERNFDLGHFYRRSGWNVFIFHYRGAWGSPGSFSFAHAIEDVASAIQFVCTPTSCEAHRTDPDRIVVMGHSFGGFAALMSAILDDRVKAVASLAGFSPGAFATTLTNESSITSATELFSENLKPLHGASASGLVTELLGNQKKWDLTTQASILARRAILLVGASKDDIAPPELHHEPLVRAIQREQSHRLHSRIVEADHVFSNKRLALARYTLKWMSAVTLDVEQQGAI
jgi:pimeloyl-ACP methyl ester carboxylesterase